MSRLRVRVLPLRFQVVDRRFIFQTAGRCSPEAERFVLLMRRLRAFSGVRVLTYTLTSKFFGSSAESAAGWAVRKSRTSGGGLRESYLGPEHQFLRLI